MQNLKLNHKYKLVIFDLDGTILNTLEDLADSLNAVFRMHALPERTIDEVRRFVGNGIRNLIIRAVPEGSGEEIIEKAYQDFVVYYKAHCAEKTAPYAGIPKLLSELKAAGYKTAVVSNKGDFAVQELCVQYFPGMFDMAAGEKEGVRRKPAPDAVNHVLKTLGIAREDAVYVGDSDVDIATAQNSEMDAVIVDWGFRDRAFLMEHGAKVIVSTPEELMTLL